MAGRDGAQPDVPQSRDAHDDVTLGSHDDTAPTASIEDNWIGKRLGKYDIVGLLGRGGMGIVYRAHDAALSRDVALKILPADLTADAAVRERFLAEAKSAAQVAHPNVVSIFDVGEEGQCCFIAMELISGGNVEENAPSGGAFSPWDATRIITDACRGLVAAHQIGLVHRDIKPANLIRTGDGTTKLADFGLAKGHRERGESLTRRGQVLGTPYFMSPEQCQSIPVDHRSDVYSLGATYFTLLTGRRPFGDIESVIKVMYAHCHGDDLDPRAIDENIPLQCAQIVIRATAKAPEDRYSSAAEMLTALESASRKLPSNVSSETVIASSLAPGHATARPDGRRRVVLAVGAAAVLLAAVVGAIGIGLSTPDTRNGEGPKPDGAPLVPGITPQTITFGTTTAYSGANEDLGRNVVLGVRTCFEAVNASGGIDGRELKLVVLDDRYEPDLALANMRELFDEHQVFGVIGNVGTPTAKVTVPFALERRVLFFAPMTGASFLRTEPPERYLYHYRAGYADETRALVHYFVENKQVPANQIAVFAQNDSYGDDGFDGVARALRGYGVQADKILRVGYDRNSVRISEAVEALAARRDDIRAVIMVATYKPAARLVKALKDRDLDVQFAALSFVGSEAMSEEFREIGSEYADGVIVTQVVPFYQSSATGVIRYRDMLRTFHPEARPGFVSLEGFIAAECLVDGLRRVEGELTTESLIDALDSIQNLDLGIGPLVSFGPSRHQVSDHVWGTVLDGSAKYRRLDLSH